MSAPVSLAAAQEARPNVLFIAIDDLNDWIGVLGGHPQARTPNIDRLAQRGVVFTHAYCASPICVPSRAALLTGIPPHESGITLSQGRFRRRNPDTVTLPQALRAGGYRVLGTGKVFHPPDPASWDEYFTPAKNAAREPRPRGSSEDLPGLHWGALDVDDSELFDVRVTAWAAEQLGKRWEEPVFLACGLKKPHQPWNVPRRYFERFDLDQIELPQVPDDDLDDLTGYALEMIGSDLHDQVVKAGKWKAAVRAYLATIAFVDDRVGVLLDALAAGPNADDTIVILWSDHGLHLGEKEHWKKWGLWEDTTRVPLIFAGIGIDAGVRNDHAVGLIDLFRTTTELCGVAAPEEVAGHSLVPLLENPSISRPAPVLTTYGEENSVRSDRWRYTRYHDGSEELYDHAVDPNEWTNLASVAEFAPIKAELGAWIPSAKSKD